MPLKIVSHFFTRLIATFLVVTALASASVFWYFQQQAGDTLRTLVEEETAIFDKATVGLDWEQETHRPRFMEIFQELAHRRGFVELLITYTDGKEIFRYIRTGGESMLIPESGLGAPSEIGELNYSLIRPDAKYSLIFSIHLRTARGKAVVWGMLPMEESFVSQLEGTTLGALMVVLITASLIGITILPVVRHAYKEIERHWHELQRSYLATTLTLGRAIAKRDNETSRHNFRVAYYALRLGESIGLEKRSMRSLTLGAYLHDLGKIGIPDHILLKPGKLDSMERKIMQEHVYLGLEIIKDIDWLHQAESVIRSHHERFDGDGYPHGLNGENIPIEARVFAVVDVFDALTSERPYKSAFPVEDALDQLISSGGTHFDPRIVEVFLSIAPTLHHEIAELDDHQMQLRLQQVAARYFPELQA